MVIVGRILIKGFIQKADNVSHAGTYLIHQFAMVCVVIVIFIAVSYW